MDHIYGNVSLPEMGKGADSPYSPDCDESPQYSPGLTGRKGNVSTSRGLLLLSLALSVGLLFTLAGLIAVAYLYSNAQTKLDLIEALHKSLSATLNTTDLTAGVEELLVKHKHLLTLQMSFDATSGCRVCPDGWAHNSGKCYLFSSTRKTWSQSRDHCITLGGHLAIVNSQEEQYFLSQSPIEVFYWMGLSDLETEGQWIWVDSTPLSETRAVFWQKRSDWQDEPDNWKEEDPSGENCALFTKSGRWRDNSCKNLHTYVCETVATSRVCPDGWAHNSGKCYLFSSTGNTWSQSGDHCITLGGHLAIVTSQEEQYFLSKRAIENLYWMGLSDLETEGQWIWVDSTPLNETGAVFWQKRSNGPDEPDNWKGEDPSGENCALVSKAGHWEDNSCKNLHTYVCETVATDYTGLD